MTSAAVIPSFDPCDQIAAGFLSGLVIPMMRPLFVGKVNAILAFKVEGKAALQEMIDRTTDKQLADRAWRVVWIPLKVMSYTSATAEEDAVAESHRPK